jgi:Glycosyl hydrolase family 26
LPGTLLHRGSFDVRPGGWALHRRPRTARGQAGALAAGLALLAGIVFGAPVREASGAANPDVFGVSIDGLPNDRAPLETFERMVGRTVNIANYYVDFTTPSFDARPATAITTLGSTPMITWEPMNSSLPNVVDEPEYRLASIINGSWDSLITTWATEIAAWGQPIYLRFGHEMNGDWYPWAEGVNGNTSGQYVQAWRHVHDLFVAVGATNVKWVWSPNVDYPGSTSLPELYPGDNYVDYVGIDGYNWGTSQSWSAWQTPGQVFNQTVADVRTFTQKPILLAEVASSDQGGNKARWMKQFFAWLQATPAVTGFVWFEFNKETNWLVNSSRASKKAFIAGLAGL